MANIFDQASSIVRKRLQDALGFVNQVETNRRNFVGGVGNNLQQGARSYNNFANNTFRTLEDITGAREGVKSAIRIGLQNPISQAKLRENNVYSQRARKLLNTDNPVNIGDVGNVAKFGSNFLGISPLVKSATTLKGLAGIGGTTAFGSALGAGMNAINGGNPLEGAKQGAIGTLQSLPQIYGVTRFTNPLIEKTAGTVASRLTSPLGSEIARRTTAGLGNIPEGVAINQAIGRPEYSLGEAGLDFTTGFITGGANSPRNFSKQELEQDLLRQKNQEINKQIEKLMASGKSQSHPSVKALTKQYKANIQRIQKLGTKAMNFVGDNNDAVKGKQIDPTFTKDLEDALSKPKSLAGLHFNESYPEAESTFTRDMFDSIVNKYSKQAKKLGKETLLIEGRDSQFPEAKTFDFHIFDRKNAEAILKKYGIKSKLDDFIKKANSQQLVNNEELAIDELYSVGSKAKLDPTKPIGEVPKVEVNTNALQRYKGYTKEAKQLIDSEIDRLKEQVQGVTIDKSNGYTRISGNAPWYRDFYDSYGRAPNKSEWVELAEDSLRNGNVDGFYSSLDPKALELNKNILDNKIYSEGNPLDVTDAQKLSKITTKEADTIAKEYGFKPETVQKITQGSNLPPREAIKQDIKQVELAVDKKVNLLDYFRTPDRVLKKLGLEQQGNLLKQKYNDYLDDLPKEIGKITNWYNEVGKSAESSRNIFRFLDGENVKLNPIEQKVAKEIQAYLVEWADKLKLPQDKRIASYITHIFEKDFIQKEFDPELAKILVNNPNPAKSVYDPFLQQRLGKQGYVQDVFRALDAYTKRATRKYHMDQALEPLQQGAKDLDVESLKYVKRLVDRVNLRPQEVDNLIDNFVKQIPGVRYTLGQRPLANLTKKVRNMTYRGTLGLNFGSAVRNLTQGVNTYAQLGEKWTPIGYTKAFKEILTGGDELTRVGVLRDTFIQDRNLSSTKKFWENVDKGLWVFFDMAEKINRGGAYFGAKSRALSKGLSEKQAIKEGLEMARKTQFTFGSVDTPVALQGDLVKTLAQFQSYNVKQAEFLGEMVKNKEFGGMVRWLGANLVLAYALSDLIGYDFKDAIPFSGVATGDTKLGETPAIKLATDIGKTVMGGTDKYGNPMEWNQVGKDLIPLVPAGVQINKSIQGVDAVNKGYIESGSGRVYPNTIDQNIPNYLKGGLFGKSALPGVRQMYENKTVPMGEKDSTYFKQLPTQTRAEFTNVVNTRRANDKVDTEIRDSIRGTEKTKLTNNKYYYYNKDKEEVRAISLDFNVERPKLTGNKLLDKELISDYKSALTSKRNDITELYTQGVLTEQQAIEEINKIDILQTAYSKLTAKGRKGRIPTVKKNYKSAKIKAPTLKAKSRKLKLPTINSSYVLNNLPQSQLKAIAPQVAKMPLKIDPRILKNARV